MQKLADGVYALDNVNVNYLEKILFDESGKLKIVPFSHLKDVPQNDITVFCVKHGIYNIPTQEQVEFLQGEIGSYKDQTIEICAGNGLLAESLGIKAVDNFMQDDGIIRKLYEAFKQSPVVYGDNVQQIDANRAIELYKPKVVIGAWATHIYNPKEHWREGNMYGVDEIRLYKKVLKYIHIGNESTHGKKPILKFPHKEIKAPWLISRSINPKANVIWIWEK